MVLGMSVDRRQFGRKTVTSHGWVKVPGRPAIPCVVRDVSVNGARIEVPEGTWLPYVFTLVVEAMGLQVGCEIRHRNGGSVGILFAHKPAVTEDEPAPASTTAADVVQVWRGSSGERIPRNLARVLKTGW